MPEGVQTPEGAPVELEEASKEFSRAMAAPVEDVPAPPRKAASASTEASSTPRRRGRPPKAERARVAPTPPAEQKSEKDYTEDIAGLTTGAWLAAASVPFTQPYAAVLKVNQPALVGALNAAAQNNAQIRQKIEKLSTGGSGMWMISLGVVGANMAMQSWQLMRDPELRAKMAESTRNDLGDFLKSQGIGVPEETPDGDNPAAP